MTHVDLFKFSRKFLHVFDYLFNVNNRQLILLLSEHVIHIVFLLHGCCGVRFLHWRLWWSAQPVVAQEIVYTDAILFRLKLLPRTSSLSPSEDVT